MVCYILALGIHTDSVWYLDVVRWCGAAHPVLLALGSMNVFAAPTPRLVLVSLLANALSDVSVNVVPLRVSSRRLHGGG